MGLFKKKTSVMEEEYKDLRGQVERLVKEKRELKEELEELKLKKKLEKEEIAHLQRINEERLKQELEGEKLKLERNHQEKVTQLEEKTMKEINKSLIGFHDKMEKKFSDELKNMKDLMNTLVKVLPNVNMEITKHIGDPTKVIEHKGR
jgi:chromosome segregation ATPase